MSATPPTDHWQSVYTSKADTDVSWFEATPRLSLDLIRRAGATPESGIIDIGGGASRLVDHLLDAGLGDLTVLDISAAALAVSRSRLGASAARVRWVASDVTTWQPERRWRVWHDRAACHFLTRTEEQAAYAAVLRRALEPGGMAIIGTFAPDGPERCSGLPVCRHDSTSLAAMLGDGFTLVDSLRHVHPTPWGAEQRFQFSLFRREG